MAQVCNIDYHMIEPILYYRTKCVTAFNIWINDSSCPFSATTTVPYSSAPTTPNTKFESIKSWTISTYKCSRQTLFEKLGKSSRTVDSELEAQIESLRETQRKYANILRLSRALTSHFYHVIQTQVSYLSP